MCRRLPGRVVASMGAAVAASAISLVSPSAGGARASVPVGTVARGGVSSVSNPPAAVPRQLRLRITGSARAVSVYASPGRRLVNGSARLVRRTTVRRHRISLRVPASLPAGLWFVVVCPAGAHGGCAASHRAMLRQPTRLSAPVQAHPVTEATHSASATIGSAGGTVSAKAADGTRFQLQIPARSLAADTLITVTPLSSLTSARWAGKLVGAVQLAPEGLQLAHGALLTMMPKTRVPLANQVAVSYTGNGANLHKVPLAPSRRAIQIPLTHFSGAGVGNAAGGSGAPSPAAGSVVDAYDSQGAGIMEQYRAGNVSKSDAEAAMGSVLNAMYKAIMATEVPPGMNDDAAAQRAIADLLHCAYLADLFGISDNATAQVAPTIGKLEDGIYNRAQAKCADQHDLAQTTTIIKADHDEQLIGLRGHTTAEDFKCMRFRVDFDSLITITNPPAAYSGHYQLEYVAHPTISFSGVSPANGAVFEGSTTARYATAGGTMFFTSQPTDYMTIQSATPAAFTVDGFSIDHHPQNPVLTLALATPTELQYNHYSDGTSFTNTTELWMTSWATIHEDAAVPGAGDAWALTLHPGSGSLIARGSWSGSTDWGSPGGTRADEATTIDVIHTPNG